MGRDLATFAPPPSPNRRIIRNLAMVLASMLLIAVLAWKLCWVPRPTAVPTLSKQWHEQVYGLDADEVLRLIPPPYSPERMQILAGFGTNPGFPAIGQIVLFSQPQPNSPLTMKLSGSIGDGTVLNAAIWATTPTGRYVDKAIENTPVHGDWIVRGEAPEERRIQALVPMLKQITGKDFAFEKGTVEGKPKPFWFVHERRPATQPGVKQ
jgi:hypothetical protein